MIFQHFNLLWSRTVISNIMFPLEIAGVARTEAKKRALELVELVGLKGREKLILQNYRVVKTKSWDCSCISERSECLIM